MCFGKEGTCEPNNEKHLSSNTQWSGVMMMSTMKSLLKMKSLTTITSTPIALIKMLMPITMRYSLLRSNNRSKSRFMCPNHYGHIYPTHHNHSHQHRHFCRLLNEHHHCPQPSRAHSGDVRATAPWQYMHKMKSRYTAQLRHEFASTIDREV